jgi:hypothetical protein
VAILIHLCAAPALPLTSSDLYCNLGYGRVVMQGGNPYLVAPAQLPDGDPFRAAIYERWAVHPTPYGPAVAFLDAAAAATGSFGGAIAIFKLLMLGATLLAIWMGAAICRTPKTFALLACNPLVAWELSGQAHNDALLVLGICGFFFFAARERWWPAYFLLALSLWTKPAALPFVGLILVWQLRADRPRALAATLLIAALGAVLYLPFWSGPPTLQAILRELHGDPQHLTHSFTAVLFELGGLSAYRIARWSSLGILFAFAALGLVRSRTLPEAARSAALFYLVFGLAAAPWMQAWYLTWIPPLLMMANDSLLEEVTALWSVLFLFQYAIPFHTATAPVVNGLPLVYWLVRKLRIPSP